MDEKNILEQTETTATPATEPVQQPEAPANPPKKGKKTKLLVILAAIVLVIIVAVVASNASPAAKVEKMIDSISVVTLDSEAAIIEAENAYNELAEADKSKVANSGTLTELRTKYDSIKEVYDAIEGIGEVSMDSASKIKDARTLFDACDAELQEQVTNKDTLLAAEEKLSALKVDEVTAAIAAIGTVKLESKTAIEAAEKLYKALSDTDKAKVANYSVLTKARTDFDALAKTEGAKKAKSAFAVLKASYDKVQNITWYEPNERPYYADTRSYVLPYIGMQNGNAWLRFVYWYTGDEWIFWKNVIVMVDGKKYYDFFGAFGTERDNDTEVWEYVDKEATAEDIEMLNAIADSTETIVRFQGDNYHYDLTISASDKKAIRNVLTAYEYAEYLE